MNRRPRSESPELSVAGPAAPGSDPSDAASTLRRGAKAFFYDGTAVLMTQEQRADGSTFWTFPGGGVGPRESPREGLRRELREELRCIARVADEVGRCRYRHTTDPDVVTRYRVFSCTLLTGPDANPAEGVLDYAWVDPANPPAGTLIPFRHLVQGFDDRDARAPHSPRPDQRASDGGFTTESRGPMIPPGDGETVGDPLDR